MKYLRVKNWDDYQHYSNRAPPWIKLHRELLTSRTWVTLDDASRVLAIACMLLASATNNQIPADAAYIKRVAYLNADADWSQLVETEFVELVDESGNVLADASKPLASANKCLLRGEESRGDIEERREERTARPRHASRETSPDWMLDFKLAYPERSGDQGWTKAARAANARISEGHTPADFIAGAHRYAEFCKATGSTGSQYVKQACTFLGPDKAFLLPWHPPPKAENASARILRKLNGTDDDRVIDHEAAKPLAITHG